MSKRANGEGCIYRRPDGRWTASITLGWKNGKQARKHCYGKARQEVYDKLSVLQEAIKQGGSVADDRITVAAHFENWLASVRQSLAPMTVAKYEILARVHILPQFGKTKLNKLKPGQIQAFLNGKLDEGLAPASVVSLRGLFSSAMRQAVDWDLIRSNPVARTKNPKMERREFSSLSPEQMAALLEAARPTPLYALIAVGLGLGLRISEALGLCWKELHAENRTAFVRQQLQWVNGKYVLRDLKSKTSRRVVPMPEFVIEALEEQRLKQAIEPYANEPNPESAAWGLVFRSQLTGGPLDRNNVNRDLQRLLAKSGLPKLRYHDLRHTFASQHLAFGTPLQVARDLLGHSTVTTTSDLYGHLVPSALRDAANRMDVLMKASREAFSNG